MRSVFVVLIAGVLLTGCPFLAQVFDAPATLIVNNMSQTAQIDEVRLKGPNDGSFGANQLEAPIPTGQSASILVSVPATNQAGQVSNSSADFEVKVVYCCQIDISGSTMSEPQTVTLVEGETSSASFGDECNVGSCP